VETFLLFLFTVALTGFFVRRYLAKLAPPGQQAHPAPPAGQGGFERCPRCQKPTMGAPSFCPHCGAAFSMWKINRAPVQAANTSGAPAPLRPVINASVCMGCGSCAKGCPEVGALQVINGKSRLVRPELCVSHGRCATACPTGALTLSHDTAVQTLRVPLLSEHFETSVPGLFVIGELGGNGFIRSSINEGRLVVEHLRGLLGNPRPAESDLLDLVIVGSGPAGLSASLTAHQYGLKYLTLEQGEVASTIRHYPRHKFVMAEPVDIPLYGNLYIGDGAKETLLAVWDTIVKNTGIHLRTKERVETIVREEEGFRVGTGQGSYRTRYVVLAIGKQGVPRRLGVPGEESNKVFYRLIEAETYRDRDILVVGGGDSALEAAVALARVDGNRVTVAYRGNDFQRARERNRQQLEAEEATGKIRVLRSSQVAEILEDRVKVSVAGSVLDFPNHFVFVLAGGESPEDFLRKTGVKIVEKRIS